MTFNPLPLLIDELGLPAVSIAAVIHLLQEGNTIPFIARYRKEATGNLDEVQIRAIQERLLYLTEMDERRKSILASIESQGKLTPELALQINACVIKTALEDLYLPYKPKRRTRATIAREKGLERLALRIIDQPSVGAPLQEAELYIDVEKGVEDIEQALAGARDIVAESIAENADVRQVVREAFNHEGVVCSKVVEGQDKGPTKFEQYYAYHEKVSCIPSHRYLAIRRGEKEGVLHFNIDLESETVLPQVRKLAKLNPVSPFAEQLEQAIQDSLKRLALPSVETDVRVELKLMSDRAAVDVFASNLRHLLLASPLGSRSVIGIDPGIRSGCKCAVVDETGKFLETVTLFPFQGERQLHESEKALLALIANHKPFAISIGNGTAGRETEAFVRQLLSKHSLQSILLVQVSEAGASVYSASDVAREEFPDLDLTIRGAISIARRLQDPLSELVKVDPKAIGVGQYQHDVYQPMLQDKLHEVVESCVNHVGVEVNTASAPLLAYVAGIGPSLAQKIVKYREMNGSFKGRSQLLKIPGMGPKTFEQAAGFLRVRGGEHPLDSSAVHPERYALIEQMAREMGIPLSGLIADAEAVKKIDSRRYAKEVGEHTLADILLELQKPGRDPRATFEPPCFREDVTKLADLKIGMKLEGIVTNVTAFGAFVDIGVHQDGLVHISQLTDKFIKDPSEAVQTGQKIKVEVVSVDIERKRIALTARMGQTVPYQANQPSQERLKGGKNPKVLPKERQKFDNNPFAGLS